MYVMFGPFVLGDLPERSNAILLCRRCCRGWCSGFLGRFVVLAGVLGFFGLGFGVMCVFGTCTVRYASTAFMMRAGTPYRMSACRTRLSGKRYGTCKTCCYKQNLLHGCYLKTIERKLGALSGSLSL